MSPFFPSRFPPSCAAAREPMGDASRCYDLPASNARFAAAISLQPLLPPQLCAEFTGRLGAAC